MEGFRMPEGSRSLHGKEAGELPGRAVLFSFLVKQQDDTLFCQVLAELDIDG